MSISGPTEEELVEADILRRRPRREMLCASHGVAVHVARSNPICTSGYQWVCLLCERAYRRRWYANNADSERARARRRKTRRKRMRSSDDPRPGDVLFKVGQDRIRRTRRVVRVEERYPIRLSLVTYADHTGYEKTVMLGSWVTWVRGRYGYGSPDPNPAVFVGGLL